VATLNIIPYFNEEYHLLLRIDSTLDLIDRLVICEADMTHTGNPKSFTCEEMLSRRGISSDKITVIRVSLPSAEEEPSNWARENRQRDTGIRVAMDGDVVIFNDCDELLSRESIRDVSEMAHSNPNSVVALPMSIHNCRADMAVCYPDGSQMLTYSSFACLASALRHTTPSAVRDYLANQKGPDIRVIDFDRVAGWHLTWMGKPGDRLEKLMSFAHADDDVGGGLGTLNGREASRFVESYAPSVGSADLLNRQDHRMFRYPVSKLPAEILGNRELRDFFLPSVRKDIYK